MQFVRDFDVHHLVQLLLQFSKADKLRIIFDNFWSRFVKRGKNGEKLVLPELFIVKF